MLNAVAEKAGALEAERPQRAAHQLAEVGHQLHPQPRVVAAVGHQLQPQPRVVAAVGHQLQPQPRVVVAVRHQLQPQPRVAVGLAHQLEPRLLAAGAVALRLPGEAVVVHPPLAALHLVAMAAMRTETPMTEGSISKSGGPLSGGAITEESGTARSVTFGADDGTNTASDGAGSNPRSGSFGFAVADPSVGGMLNLPRTRGPEITPPEPIYEGPAEGS